MFTKLLVGVDEREGSEDAVALARRLAAPDAELTLGYIYRGNAHIWRGACPPFESREREIALERLESVASRAGIDAAFRCHGASTVGRGLHELAERTNADLIVVGSSRRGQLGRAFLGDDAHAALNGAPCAVAIAPCGYARRPGLMREIGVAYNGSAESDHAVEVARQLARAHGAKLSAFEAVMLPPFAFATGGSVDELIDSTVEDARERVSTLDAVEPHAAYGLPVEELTLFSASLDLLVVGSRSYGPIGRLIYGSTSGQLARTARCPLLVLTRAAPKAANDSSALGLDQLVV